jgi:hypothetical protein
MTNVAQPVTNSTNHHRPVLHGDAPARRARGTPRAPALDDNLLPLTGGVPQTINVSVIAGVPFFSLPGAPDQRYTGIKWQTNGYALMITFAFAQPPQGSPAAEFINELAPVTPALWFSDTFPESSPSNQMCCVPSTLGEYHFNVVLGDGSMVVDPKIVVIPIIT